jgi:3-keto-5-aminohexanoate cleavage enzyme
MGPLNRYDRLTSENTRELVSSLHAEMRERNIKPELEVFNDGHLNESLAILEEFEEPPYLNFLFGGGTTSPPHPRTLVNRVEGLPERVEFTVIGLGRHQLPMTTQSLLLGGHVRVGLEDNRYYERGELATNEALVARAARIAEELGRPVATPAETRELLGLRGR